MRRVASGLFLAGVAAIGLVQAQEPEERVVQIDTLNVRDVLYHLSNGGANALALIDEINGGVVLIDTKLPEWGAAVAEGLAQVTDLPVTTIINTHAHPDHAGSNGEFPTVTEIIAHERTRDALRERATANALPAVGVPTTTFSDRFTLLEDLDRIELYHFGPGHTDGDAVVVFPEKGVAYLGDLFPSKSAPVIDTEHGGSGVAFPDTLDAAVLALEGVTRVITGHGPFPTTYAGRGRRDQGANRAWTGWMTLDDLDEYADFNRDFLSLVTEAHGSGQTIDEAERHVRAGLADRYADYDLEHARTNVEVIYRELR